MCAPLADLPKSKVRIPPWSVYNNHLPYRYRWIHPFRSEFSDSFSGKKKTLKNERHLGNMNTNNQIVTQKKLLGWYSDTPPFLATVESEKVFFFFGHRKGESPSSWQAGRGNHPSKRRNPEFRCLKKNKIVWIGSRSEVSIFVDF